VSRLLSVLVTVCWVAATCDGALGAEGTKLRYVTAIYLDAKGVGMQQPEGVACDDKSTVVVGDTAGNRLLRYTIDDRDVKPAGEIVAPQLSAPIRVRLNTKAEIFALDGKQRRIVRFGANGEFKSYLSPEGIPEPATVVPRSFTIDRNDNVYVLDVFAARVLVLGPDGKYQRHVPFPPDAGFFSDVAVNSQGVIYVLDSVRGVVYAAGKDAKAFAPTTKNLRAHLSFGTSMTVDSRGVLYIVDQNGGGVVLVGQDGSVLGRQLAMGWNEGLLYYPSQICLNEKGQVFIADPGNSRVQVFAIVR
jgi:sugar lactone lactonase YvrE